MLGIIIIGGDIIFAKLGITAPALYEAAKNHKMIIGLVIYMGGNFLRGYVTRTRAFEVYVNENLVSSFLQNGSVLPVQDLINVVMKYVAADS